MKLIRFFFSGAMAVILVIPGIVFALGSEEVSEKASEAVYERCLLATATEGLTSDQMRQLCQKTVRKYMELANDEQLAEAAAGDFKKDTSGMVFEICYKIVLQEFKP